MLGYLSILNSGAVLKRAQGFFGFEEFVDNFAGGGPVVGVVAVDLFCSFDDFALATEKGLAGW